MTIVIGQIETLKKIRETLDHKGITRFNSIGDINKFIKNYYNEKEEIFFKIEHDFDLELDTLQAEGFNLQKNYDNLKTNAETKLKSRISNLRQKCESLASIPANNAIMELTYWYQLQILLGFKFILEKSFNLSIRIQIYRTRKSLKSILKKINACATNRQSIISTRCAQKFKELEYTKTVVTELNPLIAGAIGENLVSKELKKLSDKYILFDDFSIDFERPIYYKKDNNRIHSIQIDHLLVTNSGLFIIETKNWSKKSIRRLDLRSPIKQIDRSSFALYATLTYSRELVDKLYKHHWGQKKIPIKRIVVMINQKPKEKFKFVKVATLNELNRYITYFDPIFDDSEVEIISKYLNKIVKKTYRSDTH